ncbi:HAD family hydrolase [Allokutzneria sp. NRRL B-24872]|uniref:HAD family hydrolase n=1 Tax=Allokutzneria sp. NRRL B-24872 TaxID=1137961 RepID=UPI000A3AFF44|nr:HAD-IA family hydrolase [Allokutzneria sp. NRRL B-24872]
MTIRGVLFDFSGTLFRLEVASGWLDGIMDDATASELMRKMTAPVTAESDVPEDFERRDLDELTHRRVHVEMLVRAGVSDHAEANTVYDRLLQPESWKPFPDTAEVLRGLRAAGVPVVVLSNIGWDIRTVFQHYGLLDLVDDVVMSYKEGLLKPDPELFRIACARLGMPPEHVLMVGDSEEADGGAAVLGSAVEIVEPLPTDQRPDALAAALKARGVMR